MNTAYGLYYSSASKVNNSHFYNNSVQTQGILYHNQMKCKLSKINIIKNYHTGDRGVVSGISYSSIDVNDCYIQENTCNYLFFTVDTTSHISVQYCNTQNNIIKYNEKNSNNVIIDNPRNISSVQFDKPLKYCDINRYQVNCKTIQYSTSIIHTFLFAHFFLEFLF